MKWEQVGHERNICPTWTKRGQSKSPIFSIKLKILIQHLRNYSLNTSGFYLRIYV